jgi:hypothetical protein
MNNKKSILLLLILIFFLLAAGSYLLYFRSLVSLAYEGKAPSWVGSMIEILYPRFEIEKQRFDLIFFLHKTDQILIRFLLTATFLMALLYFRAASSIIKNKIHTFWNEQTSVRNAKVLRVLFFSFMILIFKDIYWDLMSWGKAEVFYRPILLYKILHLSFPSETGIAIIYSVLLISCLACIFNIYPILFSIIAILNFILIQGYLFGFEKTDHGFAPFTYAGLLMPFMIYYYEKARKYDHEHLPGWPLKLILTTLALCYLFSGLEKILISNFQWFMPGTFKAYLKLHETPWGLTIMQSDLLCTLLPIMTLLFQVGFILVLFFKKSRWLFIPAAVIFHISTYLVFNVGGFTNPWILVLVFFIDWDVVIKKIR